MRLPVIHVLIRRRLLVNFRVDAEVMGRFLPPPFRPKLHGGYAIAGICLIRLEQHHLADFDVTDDGSRISMAVRSRDGHMAVQLRGHESDLFPEAL